MTIKGHNTNVPILKAGKEYSKQIRRKSRSGFNAYLNLGNKKKKNKKINNIGSSKLDWDNNITFKFNMHNHNNPCLEALLICSLSYLLLALLLFFFFLIFPIIKIIHDKTPLW